MSDSNSIDQIVTSAYEARARGDVDGTIAFFADGAVFAVAGSPAASAVPMVAGGRAAIREVLRRLIDSFDFKEVTLVTKLVDGDQAAFHWHVRVVARASGEEAETDLLDLVRVEDGRIVSFRQFADTALVNRMLGA